MFKIIFKEHIFIGDKQNIFVRGLDENNVRDLDNILIDHQLGVVISHAKSRAHTLFTTCATVPTSVNDRSHRRVLHTPNHNETQDETRSIQKLMAVLRKHMMMDVINILERAE